MFCKYWIELDDERSGRNQEYCRLYHKKTICTADWDCAVDEDAPAPVGLIKRIIKGVKSWLKIK